MKFSEYRNVLIESLKGCNEIEWEIAKSKIWDCWRRSGTVYIIGNGGSSQTASHFEIDWNKGIFEKSADKFKGKSVSLLSNYGLLTAIGNDIGFDQIFVFQLKKLLCPNDLLLSISGSGNSKNIIEAINFAKIVGAETLSLVGFDGGKVKKISDHSVHVQINDMQIAEDIHSIFGHFLFKSINQ
jgi:D-sedoheptulose 7-phosphate isomerase